MSESLVICFILYAIGYLYSFGYASGLMPERETTYEMTQDVIWVVVACLIWPALLGNLHVNMYIGTECDHGDDEETGTVED